MIADVVCCFVADIRERLKRTSLWNNSRSNFCIFPPCLNHISGCLLPFCFGTFHIACQKISNRLNSVEISFQTMIYR